MFVLEAAWEFAYPIYMCFKDPEKDYDQPVTKDYDQAGGPEGPVGDMAGIWGARPIVLGYLVSV